MALSIPMAQWHVCLPYADPLHYPLWWLNITIHWCCMVGPHGRAEVDPCSCSVSQPPKVRPVLSLFFCVSFLNARCPPTSTVQCKEKVFTTPTRLVVFWPNQRTKLDQGTHTDLHRGNEDMFTATYAKATECEKPWCMASWFMTRQSVSLRRPRPGLPIKFVYISCALVALISAWTYWRSLRMRATRIQNAYGLVIHASGRSGLLLLVNPTSNQGVVQIQRCQWQELVDGSACLATLGWDVFTILALGWTHETSGMNCSAKENSHNPRGMTGTYVFSRVSCGKNWMLPGWNLGRGGEKLCDIACLTSTLIHQTESASWIILNYPANHILGPAISESLTVSARNWLGQVVAIAVLRFVLSGWKWDVKWWLQLFTKQSSTLAVETNSCALVWFTEESSPRASPTIAFLGFSQPPVSVESMSFCSVPLQRRRCRVDTKR